MRSCFLCTLAFCFGTSLVSADVVRWTKLGLFGDDSEFELIPGTENIHPGPGVQLNNLDLERAYLRDLNLTDANFAGSNLVNALFSGSKLHDADFSGANVASASFGGVEGLTKEQFYTTASYQEKDLWGGAGRDSFFGLTGIGLGNLDLSDWDFSGQNMTAASFYQSQLTGTQFTRANLSGAIIFPTGDIADADFTDAVITGVSFFETQLTESQFYSTSNYKNRDLWGGGFSRFPNGKFGLTLYAWDMTNWNLVGQDMRNIGLGGTDLSGAYLALANLEGTGLSFAEFSAATTYNQGTRFPSDFDPVGSGLTFVDAATGDFNADGFLRLDDLQLLTDQRNGTGPDRWEEVMDLNGDSRIDAVDQILWIQDKKKTGPGDSNLDGMFTTSDLVTVFQTGKYQTGEMATWSEGDWNFDGNFDTADLVTAFQDGKFEMGPIMASTVPEPTSRLLMAALVLTLSQIRSKKTAPNTEWHCRLLKELGHAASLFRLEVRGVVSSSER